MKQLTDAELVAQIRGEAWYMDAARQRGLAELRRLQAGLNAFDAVVGAALRDLALARAGDARQAERLEGARRRLLDQEHVFVRRCWRPLRRSIAAAAEAVPELQPMLQDLTQRFEDCTQTALRDYERIARRVAEGVGQQSGRT